MQTEIDPALEPFVAFVLACRAEYLAAGGATLTHWDQLQSRLSVAAQEASDPARFVERFARGMRLGSPSGARSTATVNLVNFADAALIRKVRRETHLVMAYARLEAEARDTARREENDRQQTLGGVA